jgi:hypoxanthine-DNA glycosylase
MTAPMLRGLPPVIGDGCRLLVLGNMPGAKSLTLQQYYGNPHNAFWRIMADVFGFDAVAPYEHRVAALCASGTGAWDVLQSCRRIGSLDSAVQRDSVVANDFAAFFDAHAAIRRVIFNGAAAEQNYRRLVPAIDRPIEFVRLPSTSPAQTMGYQNKLAAWQPWLLSDATTG